MGSRIMSMYTLLAQSVVRWFTTIMDLSGAGSIYLACVFIALTFSFLLSNFGAAFKLGSDTAAGIYGKASDYATKRASRPYRLNHKHKVK